MAQFSFLHRIPNLAMNHKNIVKHTIKSRDCKTKYNSERMFPPLVKVGISQTFSGRETIPF